MSEMNNLNEKIVWESAVEEKFEKLLNKMPVFLRGVAREKVSKKAFELAVAAGHAQINEKDMVDAFFAETPFGFQGLLKNDFNEFGIDYIKYGYDK